MEVVAWAKESGEAVFGISADISQAHRCVKIRRLDWPKLGCRSSSSSWTVWLNTVGTFGVSSAAYWWTRLFACVGRWVNRVLMTLLQMQIVYVDDLHIVTAGPQKFVVLWMILAAYEAIGTPFSYHKFKGGLQVDFIGYHLSYEVWSAGLSEKRTQWIISWIDAAEKCNWMVMGCSVVEFTGRMTFVARLLLWVKPFLGPLHSWCAVLARSTVARMPVLVHVCLMYLRRQLQLRRRLVPVIPSRVSAKQAFRTDAKCELGRVVLAGWSLAKGSCKASSRWFMIEIRPSEAPWLFKPDGSSEWASTSAELLAFYAAVIAFEDEIYLRLEEEILAEVSAGTDNQANPKLQAKGSSTKWPLMGILMQLTSYMHSSGLRVRLAWRPREQNTEADDITNGDVSGFDPRLRVDLGFKDLPLDLLRDMRKIHGDFEKERGSLRGGKAVELKATKKQKLAEKTTW